MTSDSGLLFLGLPVYILVQKTG